MAQHRGSSRDPRGDPDQLHPTELSVTVEMSYVCTAQYDDH